ncbi:hypothetical protein FV234_24565 [Methylobacterium sp. WL8]|nr:hypothetical protein FV234_24565 [Methylobacterium sp. WL8]
MHLDTRAQASHLAVMQPAQVPTTADMPLWVVALLVVLGLGTLGWMVRAWFREWRAYRARTLLPRLFAFAGRAQRVGSFIATGTGARRGEHADDLGPHVGNAGGRNVSVDAVGAADDRRRQHGSAERVAQEGRDRHTLTRRTSSNSRI